MADSGGLWQVPQLNLKKMDAEEDDEEVTGLGVLLMELVLFMDSVLLIYVSHSDVSRIWTMSR